jgi:hypothetical protein
MIPDTHIMKYRKFIPHMVFKRKIPAMTTARVYLVLERNDNPTQAIDGANLKRDVAINK